MRKNYLLVLLLSIFTTINIYATNTKNNFLNIQKDFNDVYINFVPIKSPKPGSETIYKIVYKNKGTTTQSGKIFFIYSDKHQSYISSSSKVDKVVKNGIVFNYNNFAPSEEREIIVKLKVNSSSDAINPVKKGDLLEYYGIISLSSGIDANNYDNRILIPQKVSGADKKDVNDVSIVSLLPIKEPKPESEAVYKITYKNKGTITHSGKIFFIYSDKHQSYISSSSKVDRVVKNGLVFNYKDLVPSEEREIVVKLKINSSNDATNPVKKGDLLEYKGIITLSSGTDANNYDNRILVSQKVSEADKKEINDVSIVGISNVKKTYPGTEATYKITYKNKGTTTQSGKIFFIYSDKHQSYISSSLEGSNIKNGIVFNYTNLVPSEEREIVVKLKINSSSDANPVKNGDLLEYKGIITLSSGIDANNYDNRILLNQLVSKLEFENLLVLYPNPAKDYLNIKNKIEGVKINSVKVYNNIGWQVGSHKRNFDKIPVWYLWRGVYRLVVTTNKGVFSSSFIKK